MDLAEEISNAVGGEYEVEEEEVVVEEEVEEEIEEEVEEEEDEMGSGGGGRGGDGRRGEGDEDGDGNAESKGKRKDSSGGEEMRQADAGSSSAGKIFVGGVAWDTTEDTFNKHFRNYGEIIDSVIMKDKNTHMPRGFGFVTFADPSVIDRVLEDEHVIDGRTVEVKRTVPREDMPPKAGIKTKKIFVGGIPTAFTEDELKEHFSSYGEVIEHQIMLDHSTRRSRGFGFVTFKDEEAVDKIISEGRMHDLAGKQVEIKRAEPKRSSGGSSRMNERVGHGGSNRSARGYRGNSYGYGSDQPYGDAYYGGGSGYGYGRGYTYGGVPGYGAAYGSNYGGPMYGVGGYGGDMYGGGPGGYGGWYGGYGGGRGYGNRELGCQGQRFHVMIQVSSLCDKQCAPFPSLYLSSPCRNAFGVKPIYMGVMVPKC